MLHAIIMAGGSGTRFWPASRQQMPKQMLPLTGTRTMIQSTRDRLESVVPAGRTHVITSAALVDLIRTQLPELPAQSIVGEPCRRDTAPCVGLAAAIVRVQDPDAVMIVCPADHVIADHDQFAVAVAAGEAILKDRPDAIVTFGIPPTYPAESFGYIQRGTVHPLGDRAAVDAYEVIRFREKPDHQTAQAYLNDGGFYWNSGIFMWRAATILDALRDHEPAMYAELSKIAGAIGTPAFEQTLASCFAAIQGKSIDYAVMERHKEVIVIQAPFDWDDVGSWQAIARLHPLDAAGNAVVGTHIGIDSSGCIIHAQPGHIVVTIDSHDLVVVQTADATLVAPKSSEERVREAVAELKRRGLSEKI